MESDSETIELRSGCRYVRDGDWIESKDQGGSDYRLIQISNIGVGRFIETGNVRCITRETFKRLQCTDIAPGDVLVARMPEPTGRAWFVEALAQPSVTAVDVAIIRPDPGVLDGRYLAYYLNSPANLQEVQGLTTGTTRARIRRADLERLPIWAPPLKEQRRIAGILGALDDKIELNRRMGQTLESMARALFKSWFVDFDPVRARADEPSSGLPLPVERLFPDSLDDSELGEIPAGWRVATLSEIADLNPESWSRNTRPESIQYVDLANTKSGRIEATANYSSSDAPSRAQRVLRPGDTIVGTVRPGNRSYALVADEGLTASTGFAVLRPKRYEQRAFVYLCATAASSIDDLNRLADGAAYPAVRPDAVLATPALLPAPGHMMTVFCSATASLLDRCSAAGRESRSLAWIRDRLLPRLLSREPTPTTLRLSGERST
jgi:type I restriction enzyme S subunit